MSIMFSRSEKEHFTANSYDAKLYSKSFSNFELLRENEIKLSDKRKIFSQSWPTFHENRLLFASCPSVMNKKDLSTNAVKLTDKDAAKAAEITPCPLQHKVEMITQISSKESISNKLKETGIF